MCESYADQSDAESTRVEDMEEDMDSLSNDTSSEPHKPDEEPSILEPVPEEPPIVAEPVTFTLVENGTSRGKTSLAERGREERPQPFCGDGSYYGTKNNFHCKVQSS